MEFLAFGLNHQSAPRELREALSLDGPAIRSFLLAYAESHPGESIAAVSTCNRTEFYAATRNPGKARVDLLEMLERARGVSLSKSLDCFYAHLNAEAAKHMCRVASGLDSLVVGEDQILAQMREAYRVALEAGTSKGALNLLFQRVLRVAKRARAETRINEGNVSVASVAVSFVRRIFSDLRRIRVLLIGAGETGERAAQSLLEAGIHSLAVANRTRERAKEIAERYGGVTADFEDLEGAALNADVLICATAAQTPILTAPMLRRVMALRGRHFLTAIDISIPRNIDPAADEIEGLFVYDMTALEAVCEENRATRRAEARKVEAIVEEEVGQFMTRLASLEAGAVVRALRRRMEAIRTQEIARYGKAFHEHEWERLEKITQSLVNKVLHDLTLSLKSIDRESEDGLMTFDALCQALNLDPGSEEEQMEAQDSE